MDRSAFPFLCGRYGLVNICRAPSTSSVPPNRNDRKTLPLSVITRETNAPARKIGRRRFEEFGRIFATFSFANLHERRSTRVVNADVGVLPACARRPRPSIAVYTMPRADDSAELLEVDADEIARRLVLAANDRGRRRFERRKPRQP